MMCQPKQLRCFNLAQRKKNAVLLFQEISFSNRGYVLRVEKSVPRLGARNKALLSMRCTQTQQEVPSPPLPSPWNLVHTSAAPQMFPHVRVGRNFLRVTLDISRFSRGLLFVAFISYARTNVQTRRNLGAPDCFNRSAELFSEHICYSVPDEVACVVNINAQLTQKTGGCNSLGENTDHGECIRMRRMKGDGGDVLLNLRFDS